jgi:CS domain
MSTESQPSTLERSSSSVLRASLASYGQNSYYYAHGNNFHIPDDAKVVSGEGIVTGGAPVKIATEEVKAPAQVLKKTFKYAWCDDESVVKIYIEEPQVVSEILDPNTCITFTNKTLKVETAAFLVLIDPLQEEISPDSCKAKKIGDKKVVITLAKKNDKRTWYNLKAKQA